MRRIFEDILDDLGREDIGIQAKDVVAGQDHYDAYILLASEQQKCGFMHKLGYTAYDTESDPQEVHDEIYQLVPKYYRNYFYIVDTLMKMCPSIDDYKITFETYVPNTFDFNLNARIESWTLEEFMREDSKGRRECCTLWEDADYYFTVHSAVRIDFVFNDGVSVKRFVRDMNIIYKNTHDSYLCSYFYMKRPDDSSEDKSVSIMPYIKDDNKPFIAAYEYLSRKQVQYWNEDDLLDKYRKNYNGVSPYVRYLMTFEKMNKRDDDSLFTFEMQGIEHKHYYGNSNDSYILMIKAMPKDGKSFDRERLYEFLMKKLIYPMQRYNNKYYQTTVEIIIVDGGAYTDGLSENPEVIATNVVIKGERNNVEVTFVTPDYKIYPKGRKRVFHQLKDASLWVCNWKRVLNHTLYY